MNRMISTLMIAAVVTLAACVTINVYFPEAAAEEAADRFIKDVLGERPPEAPSQSDPQAGAGGWLSVSLISSAYAQQPNIDIDTPQIQAIKERMTERHSGHLADWYEAGAIGFARNGLVEIRDRSAVGLAERRNLERIVNEENADRNAVYREIAVANGHPDWESDIRETFARRWIANAEEGWYYQDEEGNWTRK